MYVDESDKKQALELFTKKYGPIEREYGPLSVNQFTDYYTNEMGTNISKLYLVFSNLVQRSLLPSIKNFTNSIELQFGNSEERKVNLDPGYISNDKMVLATTKDFYHRLYLGDGIYGEVTLHYRQGKYRYFSWTYPDYKEREVQKFLEQARAKLVRITRKESTNNEIVTGSGNAH